LSPIDGQELQAALMSVNYHSLGRQLELRGAPTVLLPPIVRPMPLETALAIVRDHAVEAKRKEQARKDEEQARKELVEQNAAECHERSTCCCHQKQADGGGQEKADRHQDAADEEYKPVDREQEALWTMLRSTPPPPLTESKQTLQQRYPAILRTFAEGLEFSVDEYDCRRSTYRAQSGLFAAALTAYARDQLDAFDVLKEAHKGLQPDKPGSFSKAVADHSALGGDTPQDYLEKIARGDRWTIATELARLQDDVGLTLSALVNDFADCMAFLEVQQSQERDPDYRVLPTSLVVVQDSQNFTTTVTVTTLVQAADRGVITKALDPQNWQAFSDAFHEVDYVEDAPRGFKKLTQSPKAGEWCKKPERGRQEDNRLLLREVVEVPSGLNPTVIARFENILRIVLHEGPVDEGGGNARLTYSLHRCLNSRYLWDERPGGILLDQGFIKVSPLGNRKTWRVSIRKILRFADRTPASWADTPLQFGQSLNYLTPAALSWWLQSDMYNAERYVRDTRDQGEESGGGG
jgi:hypothetical protein